MTASPAKLVTKARSTGTALGCIPTTLTRLPSLASKTNTRAPPPVSSMAATAISVRPVPSSGTTVMATPR